MNQNKLNESPCFNFGQILKISRMMKQLSTLECVDWIINCYLPTINENNNNKNPITIQRIMLQFLQTHHSKTKNPITDTRLNKLLDFDQISSIS